MADDFSCIEAADGEEGWDALLKNREIVLAIVDLDMPALDGYGLIKRVRAADSPQIAATPLIVVTAAKDTIAKKEAYRAGANDFISKSIDPFELLVRVRTYHQLAETQREVEKLRQEKVSLEKASLKEAHQKQDQTKIAPPPHVTASKTASAVAPPPTASDVPTLTQQMPPAPKELAQPTLDIPPQVTANETASAVAPPPRASDVPTLTQQMPPVPKELAQLTLDIRSRAKRLRKSIHLQPTTALTLAATVLVVIVVTFIVTGPEETHNPVSIEPAIQAGQPAEQARRVAALDLVRAPAEEPVTNAMTDAFTTAAHEIESLLTTRAADTDQEKTRSSAPVQETTAGTPDRSPSFLATMTQAAVPPALASTATRLAEAEPRQPSTTEKERKPEARTQTPARQEAEPSVQSRSSPAPTAKLTKTETPSTVTSSSREKRQRQTAAEKPRSTPKTATQAPTPSSDNPGSNRNVVLTTRTSTPLGKKQKQSSAQKRESDARDKTRAQSQESEQDLMVQAQKKQAQPSAEAGQQQQVMVASAAPSVEPAASLQKKTQASGPEKSSALPRQQKSAAAIVAKATPPAPQRITPATLATLLQTFISSYDAGNLDQLMSLFTEDAQTNARRSRAEIRKDYADLFRTTDLRAMKLRDINWKLSSGRAQGWGRFEVKVRQIGKQEVKIYVGQLKIDLQRRGPELRISRLIHSQTKLQAIAQ